MLYTCTVDGWFLVGSSALTGNTWDGGLAVFSGYEDYLQCPNLSMVVCNTPSGVNDALWYYYIDTVATYSLYVLYTGLCTVCVNARTCYIRSYVLHNMNMYTCACRMNYYC